MSSKIERKKGENEKKKKTISHVKIKAYEEK